MRTEAAEPLGPGPNMIPRDPHIGNMNDLTFQQRYSGDRATFRLYGDSSDVFDEFRRETIDLCKKELSAYLPGNGSFVGFAKSCG